jgi:hypothetical protein
MVASAVLNTPNTAYINIPQGAYRIDVILQNIPADPTPCYFAMVIMLGNEVVYSSAKEGWILDDATINDSDIPPGEDYRYKLPVFSVLRRERGIIDGCRG